MLVDTALYKSLTQLADWLFSSSCSLCGSQRRVTGTICQPCIADLPVNRNPCQVCALPIPSQANGQICGACLTEPPDFDQVFAPLLYQAPVDKLISQLKYQSRLASARTCAALMFEQLRQSSTTLPQALIAVPLHSQRLKQRGYNQTHEIGRLLAADLHLPLLTDSVIRQKATQSQTGLSAKARRQNLRNAFLVQLSDHYDHIAVVDDVMTTGSTAAELAKALKIAGVKRVDVWVVARVDNQRQK